MLDQTTEHGGQGEFPVVGLQAALECRCQPVLRFRSLDRFTETHLSFLDQLMESIGVVLNTIEANSRT